MGFVEDLIEGVGGLAREHWVRGEGPYTVGSAFFDVGEFDGVWERIKAMAVEHAENGELIESSISKGRITDSGVPGFEIKRGRFAELYLYQETEAIFIRLYHLKSGEREWAALYLDENKKTPWWSREERGGV